MNHASILVVYNRSLSDCEAVSGLLSAPTQVLVYDNSEKDFENEAFCAKRGWQYLGGSGNVGLSRAYQACIDRLEQMQFSGLITVFDDDTTVSSAFLDAMCCAVDENPGISLFFPILSAGGRIVSPQIIHENQHAEFFSDPDACVCYRGKEMFAFNSGMTIRSEVFRKVQYNTELFLDGIDYDFLLRCYQQGMKSMAVPFEMEHGFSGTQHPSADQAEKRFSNYARDHAVVLKDNPSGYRYLVGKRALHLALMYHKLSFLRIFKQNKPKKMRMNID